MRQAQHGWIHEVSEHGNDVTRIDGCNDEAAQGRDEQHDPSRILRRGAQDCYDNDTPHDEVTDSKEACKGYAEDEQRRLQLEQ